MTNAVNQLAHLANEISGDRIPSHVREHAHRVVSDTVGAIVLGMQDPELQAFAARTVRPGSGPSAVLGSAHRTEPARAALFNAAACTVTQIDEGHREARGHPAIHILPAALAVAEAEGKSGKQFVDALVAGYEVSVRIGRAMAPLRDGLHAHGHWPVIGAAIAASKLLGGSEAQLAETIEAAAGLVLHPPTLSTTDGATSHHLFAGLGSQIAVEVAYGVAAGMTATSGTLVDYLGPLSSDFFDRNTLTLESGREDFDILDNYFKPLPVCAHLLTTIQAIEGLGDDLPDPSEVDRVVVATYGLAAALASDSPRSQLAGKFSIPYAVAMALNQRPVDAQTLHAGDVHDSELRSLMRRVEVRLDSELDAQYPASRPSIVTIFRRDGSSITNRADIPLGDFVNPMTDSQLEQKFHEITEPTLGRERSENLYRVASATSDLADLSGMTSLSAPVQGEMGQA